MKRFTTIYLFTGLGICLVFATATYFSWRLPSLPSGGGYSGGGGYYGGYYGGSGRSSGGSWGFGK